MTLELHLFGRMKIMLNNQPLRLSILPKSRQLLAYLLLHRQTAVSRDQLAFLFWSDTNEENARTNLRRHLYDIRHALPPDMDWLLSDSKSVQWNNTAPYWLDTAVFETYAQDNNHLADAVTLYSDDLLSDMYEDWVIPHRERLHTIYADVIGQLVRQLREQGKISQAIHYAQQLLSRDPLREDILRELLTLRHAQGDKAGAIQLYQQFIERLANELSVMPMPETTAVYEAIVANKPTQQPSSPTLPTPNQQPMHNLPSPVTTFVGRQQELTYIHQLFAEASSIRLLTITGPGGSGKTRLALQAANQLLHHHADLFPDGIFFVRLADLTEPSQLPTAVAQILKIPLMAHQPIAELVAAYLQPKSILLVMDSSEHLPTIAPTVSQWLAAAPNLRIMVTSQVLLQLYGEHELPLAPLPLPEINLPTESTVLLANPAIALFVDRARAVRHDFAWDDENSRHVVTICTNLEGMPLAIELAAARSKSFSPADIRDQLNLDFLRSIYRDLSPRQQTLQATIDWSYRLLTDDEQAVFRCLAVFTGAFTEEAVLAVAETAVAPNTPIATILKTLVARSLVRQMADGTYRLFTTLQDFGLEKLIAADNEDTLRWQHAHYYRQWAEMAEIGWRSREQSQWVERLTAAESNIAAALPWLFRDPDNRACWLEGTLLAGALERFWTLRGRLNEGAAWLEKGLMQRHQLPPPTQINLLNKLGGLKQWQGDYDAAVSYHQEALALARQFADETSLAHTLHYLGNIAGRQGNYEAAGSLLEESLTYHRRLPDITLVQLSPILNNLSIVYRRLGDHAAAITLLQEAVALRRQINDQLGLASNLGNLTILSILAGDTEQAAVYLQESLTIRQQLDDHPGLLFSLGHVAYLSVAKQKYNRAICLYAAEKQLRHHYHIPATADVQSETEENLAVCRKQVNPVLFNQFWRTGESWSLQEATSQALRLVEEMTT